MIPKSGNWELIGTVLRPRELHLHSDLGDDARQNLAVLSAIERENRPPLSLEDARRLVEGYVTHYNTVRLNSAVGYITPKNMLAGRPQEIHAERDRKLEDARKQRQVGRQQAA